MANVIIRRVNLTNIFQPLSSQRLVGNFTIRASGSSDSIALQTDNGLGEVPIGRSESFTLKRVNLQDIQAKGSIGDFFTIIGATAK